MSDPAGHAARAAYRGQSFATRVHVGVRWRTCPFRAIADAVVGAGTVLDVGCGHGLFPLYLAARDPSVQIVGVDVDTDKLDIARAAADCAGVAEQVAFRAVEPGWTPADGVPDGAGGVRAAGWAMITVVDVLYLLGHDAATRLIADTAGALAAGGRVVVKELDTQPAWKWRVSLAQEVLATKVLRITAGEQLEHVGIMDLESMVRGAGLEPTTTRLDRYRLHPDYLTVATTRPASV